VIVSSPWLENSLAPWTGAISSFHHRPWLCQGKETEEREVPIVVRSEFRDRGGRLTGRLTVLLIVFKVIIISFKIFFVVIRIGSN
jgi:hypothetical protein